MYAQGASYLLDTPQSCANCHVMQDHLDAWRKSSHASVATCNDCHTPSGLVASLLSKARNGVMHSWAFTTDRFHEPIAITATNRAIVEAACRSCHDHLTEGLDAAHGGQLRCLHCHSEVGH